MKTFIAKYSIILGIAAVVIVGGGIYWYLHSSETPTFNTITVQKGNVIESVDEPGNVLTNNSADLSFQEGGEIAQVDVKEGSVVSQGTVLASLDKSQLNAAVQEANAALAAAQAQLSQLQSGTRPEQLQIDESAVTSASTSLNIAVQNAYSSADDAVTNQLDNLFNSPQTNNPIFLVPDKDTQSQNNIQSQRVALGTVLNNWYAELNSTSSQPVTVSVTADSALEQITSYINSISIVVNAAVANTTLSAATLSADKAYVSTARAEVEAATTAVSGAESALTAAQNQLTLAQAGATTQQIQAQSAAVQQAQAAATSAQVALDNASLVAPFSGTVQNLTAKIGEVVSPGSPMLTLINNGGLEVQAYVSETDIAKIKQGDPANVTLDAYGTGTVFPATVATIDAAQTEVNGSNAYLVTLYFKNADARIKDGMTGNVSIIAAEHDNVIEVPTNLVINDGNNNYVLVQNGSAIEKTQVQVGITGNNGTTEITSGLSVGETLTNF
jgi:HlyD family secretion protein